MANPYHILRIQANATPQQIEEAYYRMRRLASYGSGVKEETLNLAYAILSDPERRQKIDEALKRRRGMAPARGAVKQSSRRPSARRRSWLTRLLPFL